MPGFVPDASVALTATLPGKAGAAVAVGVISRIPAASADGPQTGRTEVGKAIVTSTRRGGPPTDQVPRVLGRLNALPVTVDQDTDDHAWNETLRPALRLQLSLATSDTALRRAAMAAGVLLANPLA